MIDATNMKTRMRYQNYEQQHPIVLAFYETIEEVDECLSKNQDAPRKEVSGQVIGGEIQSINKWKRRARGKQSLVFTCDITSDIVHGKRRLTL